MWIHRPQPCLPNLICTCTAVFSRLNIFYLIDILMTEIWGLPTGVLVTHRVMHRDMTLQSGTLLLAVQAPLVPAHQQNKQEGKWRLNWFLEGHFGHCTSKHLRTLELWFWKRSMDSNSLVPLPRMYIENGAYELPEYSPEQFLHFNIPYSIYSELVQKLWQFIIIRHSLLNFKETRYIWSRSKYYQKYRTNCGCCGATFAEDTV